jgi:phosphoglycerol transferase MdoB-like AlkP superfamily enzyme
LKLEIFHRILLKLLQPRKTRGHQLIRRIAARFFPPRLISPVVPGESSRLRVILSWTWGKTRLCLGNRYFAFLVFIVALAEVLSRLSDLSGMRSHFWIEGPILLGLYWALNFALKPGKLAPFVAAFPFVVIYTAYDLFYIAWGNVFKVIDFENLPELLQVLPLPLKAALLLALGLPVVLVLCFLDYRRYRRVLAIGALAAFSVVAVEFWPNVVLGALDRVGFRVAEWSDAELLNENGRVTTMLYFEARRRESLAETATYRNRTDYDTEVRATADYIRKHGNHRNVHLLVLESFVDPTLFRAVTFSKDPRYPDFAKLVGDRQSFSISPVFGGETAQAEFEALCGVPALQKLSEIEFDDFTGEAAGCMPGILAQAGYSSIVSNSFEPNYFNSTKAYTGIGFEQIYFPVEYGRASSSYLTTRNVSPDELYMFDGDLFDQNLAFVARTLHVNPGQPILNYVLGIYGHEPHDIDTAIRPLVVSVKSGQTDQQLLRAANQYWYRTQAIARYVRGLIKLDPKSLIIIVSDHLPPLEKGVNSYKDYRYLDNVEDSTHLNRILIVENGKVVRHKTIHHYEIPSVIYDYLTSKGFCIENDCVQPGTKREEKYMSLMSRAVGRR